MPYLVCGLGQAGGKIVDEMFAHPAWRRLATPFAINSTAKDLSLLHNIPRPSWVGVSEDKGLIEGSATNFEGQVVGGFGKDPEQAAAIMAKNHEKVVDFFTNYAWKQAGSQPGPPTSTPATSTGNWTEATPGQDPWTEVKESIPFALLVVGLGGGTGCGIAGSIARAIRESSSVNTTVIAVGILPATFDAAQAKTGTGRQAWNALFALESIEPHVDGIILVDNECLAHTGNPETHFHEYNRFVANALVELFSAHLLDEIDLSKVEGAALPVVDIQDVKSALALPAGKAKRRPGYASLGWGATMTQGALAFTFASRRHLVDLDELMATSLHKQTLVGLDLSKASKSLGLLRLPLPMTRTAAQFPNTATVEARLASYSQMDEVHFGITVTRKAVASLTTLLTFEKKDVQRLESLGALAAAYAKRKASP
jgi:cell division GTPase FtsZ